MFHNLTQNIESEVETLTFAQPDVVLSKSLCFVRKKESSDEETSLVEILSSSSSEQKVSCNSKSLFRVTKDSPFQEEIPTRIHSNLIVDWESDLMNSLSATSSEQKKVRAICSFAVQKQSSPQTPKYDQLTPCLIDDWNFENLTAESFRIFQGAESSYRCIGFLDGKLVKIKNQNWGSYPDIYLEDRDVMLEGMEKVNVPSWNSRSAFLISLPSNNVEERSYSLSALVGSGNLIYLFNIKEKQFEKVELKDLTLLSDFEIRPDNCQVIIKEGKMLRVFILQENNLYELRWDNGQIIVVDHLVWLRQEIKSIVRLENSLLVETTKGNFVYTPSSILVETSKGTLALVKIPENSAHKLIWDDSSKCLINVIGLRNGESDNIILTSETISKLENKPLSEYYSEEELAKQYQFNSYVPPKITDALLVTEQVDSSFRGKAYYDCRQDRYNDMEIIAGIRCRENEKLKFAISPHYVELSSSDLADYLGAPIMIPSFEAFNLASIHDMVGKRRDSKQLCIKTGVFKTNFDLTNSNNFLAILSPKDENSTQEVVKHVANEEWKELATRNQFRVESNQIRAADFSTHGYVEIENVESGIWCYNQKIENDLPAQLIVYNQQYKETINPDIAQDWSIPDETFAEELHNSYCISELTTQTRQLSNDWQVSVCGVCVDGGLIGIFDAVHYKDDSIFSSEAIGFDIHFPSRATSWFGKLNKILAEQGNSLVMNVPYGVISRDAETGDGTFACLSKVYNGKVVAVKIIIQHEAYHSQRFTKT